MGVFRRKRLAATALSAALALTAGLGSAGAETLEIGIGIQNTTTNTVTGGVVLQQLGLFQKLLPKTGKYKDVTYSLSWQNFTSGPPITNGMMANNIQIGMMGDFPLLVDGATGQATGNATELVAILAYNAHGGGNGIVVNKDTPLYDFDDLKGKTVSVPFGSAAHGMLLRALQMRGLTGDFWNLVSQSPEIGTTNLQQKRIDAHADFVPFPELLPFRGFARKIYDGAETGVPTLHGVVVRKDFADKYPEIVVAYIKAVMEANKWFRSNPQAAAGKIEDWTKINKEVAYIYLGPNGIMTLDPTIKPAWVAALTADHQVLQHLNMIKPLDVKAWVNDTYVRQAFKDEEVDYDRQLGSMTGYDVKGRDPVCKTDVTNPAQAGQVWVRDGDIVSFSSAACTLLGVRQYQAAGKTLNAVYLVDHQLGLKVFADEAFFAVNDKDPTKPAITPFLLKRDAEAYAKANGGKLATYAEAIEDVANFTPEGSTMSAEAMPATDGPIIRYFEREKPDEIVAPAGKTLRPPIRISSDRLVTVVSACLSIGSLFVIWYLGTKYRVDAFIRFQNIPTPHEVFVQAGEVIGSTKFLINIGMSLERILLGFAVAIVIGVPLGLLTGRYRRIKELVMPAVEVLRPIPAIAWVPMSIMLWPSNESSIIFITFIGAFFPILLNTIHGVQAMDGVLLRAGQCLGASEPRLFWHVILPGSLSHIFTGLAIGMGVAWVSLIAAEMISGQFGVGYYTWEAYSLVNYPAIVLGMITIGMLGLLCSGAIRLVGRLTMPWLAFAAGSRK